MLVGARATARHLGMLHAHVRASAQSDCCLAFVCSLRRAVRPAVHVCMRMGMCVRVHACCSSFPQARIPNGPAERVYDIKYYTRDVRRNSLPSDIPVERSFLGDASKSLAAVQYIEAPKEGSPGMKVRRQAYTTWLVKLHTRARTYTFISPTLARVTAEP